MTQDRTRRYAKELAFEVPASEEAEVQRVFEAQDDAGRAVMVDRHERVGGVGVETALRWVGETIGFVETLEELESGAMHLRIECTSEVALQGMIAERMTPFDPEHGVQKTLVLEAILSSDEYERRGLAWLAEEAWVRVDSVAHGIPMTEFIGHMFARPEENRVEVGIHPISREMATTLTELFTPAGIDEGVGLAAPREATGLQAAFVCALPVGQGSAVALVTADGRVIAYVDAGCGCYLNSHTFQDDIVIPSDSNPTVLLSHWDADHWYLAWLYEHVQTFRWIAPTQTLGPHAARVAGCITRRGELLFVNKGFHPAETQIGLVGSCLGTVRNDSGLCVRVSMGPDAAVLLPGDSAYKHIPSALSAELVGLLASHHGSKSAGLPPPPAADHCPRIGYSFGEKNRYRHPSQEQRDAASKVGWTYQATTTKGVVVFADKASAKTAVAEVMEAIDSLFGHPVAKFWQPITRYEQLLSDPLI